MNSPKPTHEILWIHLAKAIGIILVVVIHASADLFYEYGNIPMLNWWSANVYQSFSRIGVPFFFMASGFLLLGRQEDLSKYIRSRVTRILIPLAFWTLFFIWWRRFFFREALEFNQALADIFQHEAFPHLWFLYALFAVYLCYPILRPFVQNAQPNLHWYFITLWLIVLTGIPTLESYTGLRLNKYFSESIGLFSGYLGYTLLGYLLGNLARINRLIAAMIPVAVIAPIATLLRTFIATESAESINESFYSYLSLNVVLAASASFYFIRLIGDATEKRTQNNVLRGLVKLSKNSYGIYLIHPIFIQLLAAGSFGFRLSAFSGNPWINIPVVSLLSLFFSYGMVQAMMKIPLIKRLVS